MRDRGRNVDVCGDRGRDVVEALGTRILGRVTAENVIDDGNLIIERGRMIDERQLSLLKPLLWMRLW